MSELNGLLLWWGGYTKCLSSGLYLHRRVCKATSLPCWILLPTRHLRMAVSSRHLLGLQFIRHHRVHTSTCRLNDCRFRPPPSCLSCRNLQRLGRELCWVYSVSCWILMSLGFSKTHLLQARNVCFNSRINCLPKLSLGLLLPRSHLTALKLSNNSWLLLRRRILRLCTMSSRLKLHWSDSCSNGALCNWILQQHWRRSVYVLSCWLSVRW